MQWINDLHLYVDYTTSPFLQVTFFFQLFRLYNTDTTMNEISTFNLVT